MKSTYAKRNGHERYRHAHKNTNAAATDRRLLVIEQRKVQLAAGTKPNKYGTTAEKKETPNLPLTDKDRVRIQKEIEVLQSRT